jgi:predicted NAD-dependent protein-ADP-ribosyltransferase YbiA (DUF1768 family)
MQKQEEEEKKEEVSPPTKAIKESKRKVICFYRERDEYGEFSNFYNMAPITIDSVEWPTTEHYF